MTQTTRNPKENGLKIIGLAGRKRSGKSSLAKSFIEYGIDTEIISFAEPLKSLCAELMGIDIFTLNYLKDNNSIINKSFNDRNVKILSERTGIDINIVHKLFDGVIIKTVRDLLQMVGTDLIRENYPNWHVDKTMDRIKTLCGSNKLVIIDDVRFKNERESIEEIGGEVFFVVRSNNFDVSNHVSETSLLVSNFKPDKILVSSDKWEETCLNFVKMFNGEIMPTEFNGGLNPKEFYPFIMDIERIKHSKMYSDVIAKLIKENILSGNVGVDGELSFTNDNKYLTMVFENMFGFIVGNKPIFKFKIPMINEQLKMFL